MSACPIKRWRVGVVGFDDAQVLAHSQSAARMEAYRRYRNYDDSCTFKRFLSLCAYVRRDTSPACEHFGAKIWVNDRPAFYLGRGGNHITFVFEGDTRILSSHENDVMRPWEQYGGNGSVPF